MRKKKASELIDKYLAGECSAVEKAIVERMLDDQSQGNPEQYTEDELRSETHDSWAMIENATISRKSKLKRLIPYATAAAVVMSLAVGYLFSERKDKDIIPDTVQQLKDVPPGGNYAILTLPNGQKINLSKVNKGNIPNNYFIIEKRNNGEVVFTSSNSSAPTSMVNSTISTPKGGQYIVHLSDGSKVWLNAATEIKFPANFKNLKNRMVYLSGEAYFEVAKDAKQPFIVKTKTQEVQVLGTHFFVNSYPDEQTVRTILREGSVRVFSTQLNLSETLKPGQMAVLQHQTKNEKEKLIVKPLDEDLVAWKEDKKLKFSNSDLPSLMRVVSKWYNLTVKYEGPISQQRFTAGISRDSNLSELLRILEGMGIRFRIEKQSEETVLIVGN
ncbi:FecR family protein [Chitinophaga niabensis]|uniref:FecR protein n=1 Tax=Chitinophaga niabensis TaxID=536979 RepID=A0A1N6E358_9BACT|nr:FecR family protein [Chitinophaga niabensis]SIN77449.1 protein of unknown function [Chitinophaga niabensis]